MKKILSFFLCMIWLLMLTTMSVYAVTPIDPAKLSSLTLQYRHQNENFEGLEIKTYRIAEVYADGTYALTGDFSRYPVRIYEVTSQTEWRQIASTLAFYAEADRLVPTCTAVTDNTGTVSFTDILPGMYLTLSVQAIGESETTVFESFLTVVPYPNENGDHNYDVTAYPKCESYIPDGEREYKIIKLWKDNGHTENRPESIEIEIRKDGILQSTQQLTANNNWSYSWTAPDDGSVWCAVEREIPADYTVTITEEGNTIFITNCYQYDVPEAPQTGDTTVIWPYMLVMCISGGMLLILAAWRKRAEE